MRQFDVFFYPAKPAEPLFTDKDLGWFYSENLNEDLKKSDAEWIIFAKPEVQITRNFLNDLACTISDFPYVDAFAPKICFENEVIPSGFKLSKKNGLELISKEESLKFIACPTPQILILSKRMLDRTGLFDLQFSNDFLFLDLTLRMLHAGGKLFYVPYLIVQTTENHSYLFSKKELAFCLYKSFGFFFILPLLLKNPSLFLHLFIVRKWLNEKREKAIALSKLDKNFLKELLSQ